MKTFHEWLELAEARAPKGAPTSLNVWVMFKSLEKGGSSNMPLAVELGKFLVIGIITQLLR